MTVLLVDDDPVILKLLAFGLRNEGFSVLTADSGRDAILQWRSHPGEIDVLISDVRMPGMDGPTLAAQLVAEAPGMPVLLISGFTDSAQQDKCNGFELLPKPFSIPTLAAKVRSLVTDSLAA